MKILTWSELGAAERAAALARPTRRSDPVLVGAVRGIVDDIAERGWPAVVEHAVRLDGEPPIRIDVAMAAADARTMLSTQQRDAIELARDNIATFHRASLPTDHSVETMDGLRVGKVWRPIDRVGLYIPGGSTPLFSTLLMLAVPAVIAGVGDIIVTTPPSPSGGLDPVLAFAAELCGIESIWTVGGAQAIAALALGAGPIEPVAKILGPGNAYVAAAKNHVASLPGGPAIDMPAGPSELLVVADDSADPRVVAADLLGQAEHDPAAQVLLVTPCRRLAEAVSDQLGTLAAELPRREIAEASLANGRIILVGDTLEAIELANLYAPEHLSLAVDEPGRLVTLVRNAGAIFAGHLAAESFGDYLAGSSHVLPTDGAARAWSGISTYSFMKAISIQAVGASAAARIAAPTALLARLERLEAHALAAEARLEQVTA